MADLDIKKNAEEFTACLTKHCIVAAFKHYQLTLVKVAIQKYNNAEKQEVKYLLVLWRLNLESFLKKENVNRIPWSVRFLWHRESDLFLLSPQVLEYWRL